MDDEYEECLEKYEPLFELGLFDEYSPACKVIPAETIVDPIILAALMTVLFETVVSEVPDSEQNAFEDMFHKAFKTMLEERFEYDVVKKLPKE
jgi:hypothetical protein